MSQLGRIAITVVHWFAKQVQWEGAGASVVHLMQDGGPVLLLHMLGYCAKQLRFNWHTVCW